MKFASLMHRASRVDPSLQQAPRRRADGDPQRLGRARSTRPASSRRARRPTSSSIDLKNQMFTPLLPGEQGAHLLAPRLRGERQRGRTRRSSTAGSSTGTDAFTTIDEPEVLREANVRVPAGCSSGWSSPRRGRMRTLGPRRPGRRARRQDADLGRRADRRGPTIVAAGPREELEQRGPVRPGPRLPAHFVLPGFVNCHYHSELAIGPGLYQFIFERANVFMQGGVGDIEEEDLYHGRAVGADQRDQGRADRDRRHVLRASGDARLRMRSRRCARTRTPACAPRSGWSAATRTSTSTSRTSGSWPRLPADLADEVRRSPMGYAWPVDDVMATFERLVRPTGTAATTGSGSSPRRTGRRRAPTSCTGAAAAWPTSTGPA